VQSLLLRLGITARLQRRPQYGKGRDQFHVSITGQADVLRFISRIGAIGESKASHERAIATRVASQQANTNRDILPPQVWRSIVVPAMGRAGLTTRQMQRGLGMSYCGSTLYASNLSRERAQRVATVVKSEELARLAGSDIYWDQIVSIAPDGEEAVYDLTVEGLHSFVAADIVVHNSIEQDADVVIFLTREEMYDPETEKRHIADLYVAKHRNGPTGHLALYFDQMQTRFRDLETHQAPPPL
jgi:replicative DNA helicase